VHGQSRPFSVSGILAALAAAFVLVAGSMPAVASGAQAPGSAVPTVEPQPPAGTGVEVPVASDAEASAKDGGAEPEYSEPFPEPVSDSAAAAAGGDPFASGGGGASGAEGGAAEASKFQINGYIQSQFGVFFGWEKNRYEVDEKANKTYPTDHGGKLGQMSMLRNTLQIEADWQPTKWIALHTILRGVLSSELPSDRDAQVPGAGYLGEDKKRRQWVRDRYYNELAIRELYVDIEAHKLLNFRVGRQQVSWGETGQFRLLDVINPTNSTWHFGALESYEDQRIPQWMLKAQLEIPAMQGSLEAVWVPMLDNPEDTVTVPLTFVGAWGLPPTPQQGDASVHPLAINQKIFQYPGRDVRNSRVGARWRGEAGNFTYTLAYFWNHVQSPPIPNFVAIPFNSGTQGYDVYLGFPRQHIVGASLETTIPSPVTMNVKLEAAFEPDRTFPVNSLTKRIAASPEVAEDLVGPKGTVLFFDQPKRKVFSWALTLQRPTRIRVLNPEQSFMFVLQFMHTWIADYQRHWVDAYGKTHGGDSILEIPGYDSTQAQEHSFRLVGALFTSYLHGMLTPRILGAWLPGNGGFMSLQLDVAIGNHWRILMAVNQFFGDNPYKGLGMFRDRDEVNVRVRYQF
jgi:hypothetical protein